MAEWIQQRPITFGLLCYIGFLVIVYGGILWLWTRPNDSGNGDDGGR